MFLNIIYNTLKMFIRDFAHDTVHYIFPLLTKIKKAFKHHKIIN